MDASAIEPIARALVDVSTKLREGETALIVYDPPGAPLARRVARLAAERGARVLYIQRDQALEAEVASSCREREALRSGMLTDLAIQSADAYISIASAPDSQAFAAVPRERMKLWSQARHHSSEYRVNQLRWVVTCWPHEKEAEEEGLSYPEYVDLFLRACHQPWEEIHAAQARLVASLDAATTLEIEANPRDPDPSRRTHLRMDIGPMRFANSTIVRNFPGSEAFAAPVRDSVEGQLFAAGRYTYGGCGFEDIRFEVERGRIVRATAGKGERELNELLDTDEGARYFGEVALGTNPGLRRRVHNGLLNEKVGGSFHITPGRAYTQTEYDGDPVMLDNGNRSQIHWDIAVPMLPDYGGGEVRLDGKPIQVDGRFLDPALEVLNRGL